MSPTVFGALSRKPHAGAVRGPERRTGAERCPSGRRAGEQCHPTDTEGKVLVSLDSGEWEALANPGRFPSAGSGSCYFRA